MILVVQSGAARGRRIRVPAGAPFVVGRSAGADLPLPDDAALSARHFEIRYDGRSCRVIDLGSSNGTRVNGVEVRSSLVRDGDQIEAGGTVFAVRYTEQPEGRAAMQAGGWRFYKVPEGWEPVENLGIRRASKGRFGASVIAAQDQLPEGETLRAYIDRQILVLEGMLPSPRFGPVTESRFRGMAEAFELEIRFESADRRKVVHRQCYGRSEGWAAVITQTSLESEWNSLAPVFGEVLRNLKFTPAETEPGPG